MFLMFIVAENTKSVNIEAWKPKDWFGADFFIDIEHLFGILYCINILLHVSNW